MKDWTLRLQTTIQVENRTYHFQVARLVYYCFIDKFNMDDANLIITTKNGNGLDIRQENLALLTYTQKNHRSYDIGRQKSHFQTNKQKLMEILQVSLMKSRKVVSQYDKDGKFIATFKSIMEAARITAINHSSISYAVRHYMCTAGGYYWREGDADKINKKEIQDHQVKRWSSYRQKKGKPITQLDLQGNVLASYVAKSLASKITGIPHRAISQNIQGLVGNAGGYIWRAGNLLEIGNIGVQTYQLNDIEINGRKIELSDCRKRDIADRGDYSRAVKVTKFTPNGTPVACYNTLKSAADSVQRCYQIIASAIQGKPRVIAGYIWRRGDQMNINIDVSTIAGSPKKGRPSSKSRKSLV
ncbi:NUMOD1 domain-containing DNA-binding protein [Chitinophaga sp. XS-30]|uniref:NUMOD1 domain-containing DNA-binding protein n=1 Tax=Chitinophaga sp. XS-30 TaxID=2604421 RepID=UPI001FEF616C|nr:NUMOD1 domain-containing DNA-binding protein [Chitinophaga sp. XS-30]